MKRFILKAKDFGSWIEMHIEAENAGKAFDIFKEKFGEEHPEFFDGGADISILDVVDERIEDKWEEGFCGHFDVFSFSAGVIKRIFRKKYCEVKRDVKFLLLGEGNKT